MGSFRILYQGILVRASNHMYRRHSSNHKDKSGIPSAGSKLTDHQKSLMKRGLPKQVRLPNVESTIVVASAKGGVGKSTTAVNLALALAECGGDSVGLLDLDVFGPSLPRMMNLSAPPQLDTNDDMIPLSNYGIQCMSMGFLIEEKQAVVWRGPMVMSAVQRLLLRTAWHPIKYLVVDLPPGTGDTHLSISQLIQITGAVLVSTPQDIALLDVHRGAEMFSKVNIPLLGLVENMSVFCCPKCGHQEHIFGKKGVHRMAEELGVDVLGEVPLSLQVREGADSGKPVVVAHPGSPQASAYYSIAEKIIQKITNFNK